MVVIKDRKIYSKQEIKKVLKDLDGPECEKWINENKPLPFDIEQLIDEFFKSQYDQQGWKEFREGLILLNIKLIDHFGKEEAIERANRILEIIDKIPSMGEAQEDKFYKTIFLERFGYIFIFESYKALSKKNREKLRLEKKALITVKKNILSHIDALISVRQIEHNGFFQNGTELFLLKCHKIMKDNHQVFQTIKKIIEETSEEILEKINFESKSFSRDKNISSEFNQSTIETLTFIYMHFREVFSCSLRQYADIFHRLLVAFGLITEENIEIKKKELFQKAYGKIKESEVERKFNLDVENFKEKEYKKYMVENLRRQIERTIDRFEKM